jgi:hypothetical protein
VAGDRFGVTYDEYRAHGDGPMELGRSGIVAALFGKGNRSERTIFRKISSFHRRRAFPGAHYVCVANC